MITNAVKADIPEIIEIEKEMFPDPWDTKLFLDAIGSDDKYFFVEKADGKVAGYVIFERVHDEGHITDLAVRADLHRQGIALGLITKALAVAKELKIREVFLEVRSSNLAAISLYSKFGFSEISRRKRYYPKANEDALVFHIYM